MSVSLYSIAIGFALLPGLLLSEASFDNCQHQRWHHDHQHEKCPDNRRYQFRFIGHIESFKEGRSG